MSDGSPRMPAELLDATARRSRRAFGERVRELRDVAPSLALAAVAAAVAWIVAREVFDHRPGFFAPVAAILTLGLTVGRRGRRAWEIGLGVAVGITVADLIVLVIGTGTWQLGVVVFLSMAAAVLAGGGLLLVNQAAISAVLIVTLQAAPGGGRHGPLHRRPDRLGHRPARERDRSRRPVAHGPPRGRTAAARARRGPLADRRRAARPRPRCRGRGARQSARPRAAGRGAARGAPVGSRDHAARAVAPPRAARTRPLRDRGDPDRPCGAQHPGPGATRDQRDRVRRAGADGRDPGDRRARRRGAQGSRTSSPSPRSTRRSRRRRSAPPHSRPRRSR